MAEAAEAPSRRARKKEITRREIYDAAMGLFAAEGFNDVTISEICEKADVGRGTFFLHFPTKAALLYEFNERVTEEFRRTRIDSDASARDELMALVMRIGVELVAQSEIMSAMLADFFTSPETIAVAASRGTALADLVTEIMERGQKSHEFDETIDPRLAATAFLSIATAFLSWKVIQGGDLSDEEIQRQFLHLTFQGLGPGNG